MIGMLKAITSKLDRGKFLLFAGIGYVFASGIVFIEPAPCDILFVLMFLALPFLGRFDMRALVLIAPYALASVASTIAGAYGGFGIDWRFLLIDAYVVSVFLWFRSVRDGIDDKGFNLIMYAWTAIVGVSAFFGLLSYLFDFDIVTTIIRANRFTGFFKDPNVLASYLIVPATYWLARFFRERKPAWLVISLFCATFIFLTFSRMGWMTLALAYVAVAIWVYLAGGDKKTRKTVLVSASSVFVAIVAVVLLFVLTPTFDSMRVGDRTLGALVRERFGIGSETSPAFGLNVGDAWRMESWGRSFDMVAQSPAFGIGPGNYEEFKDPLEGTGVSSAHETYLRMLAERGIIGLAAFLALIAYAFVSGKRSAKADGPIFSWKIAIVVSVVVMLACGAIVDTLHWRHFWVLLALL